MNDPFIFWLLLAIVVLLVMGGLRSFRRDYLLRKTIRELKETKR